MLKEILYTQLLTILLYLYYFFIAGYEGESLTKLLHKIQRSSVVMMDRWQIEFSAPDSGEEEQGDPIPCNIINNYFSIGVVSLLYHTV